MSINQRVVFIYLACIPQVMPQWEYRNRTGSWTEVCRIMEHLGVKHWELVSMCMDDASFFCIFKRPLPPDPAFIPPVKGPRKLQNWEEPTGSSGGI